MYILGIHTGHDASAALVKDGEIIAVIQEERKNRIKHQNGFPKMAVREVLRIGGITADKIDHLAVAGNDRRYESFRELMFAFAGRRFYSCTGLVKRLRTFVADNTKNHAAFRKNLKEAGLENLTPCFFEHHLCHASSAYRTSGMDKALVITMDGVGDDVAASVSIGDNGNITRVASTRPDRSLGLLYQAVTESLGFMPVEGEYKTMGLAAYGDKEKLYPYFSGVMKCDGLDLKSIYLWESEWRFPAPTIKQHLIFKKLQKDHKREDIAAGCQAAAEEIMRDYVKNAAKKYGIKNICAAGGVFLNVKANKLIRETVEIEKFYIHPDSGDGGLALGAALELYFRITKKHNTKQLEHVYFGTEYSNDEIELQLKQYDVDYSFHEDIAVSAAKVLASKKVIGWVQGRMEMGPRALGARSVLADPRDADVKEKINKYLKKREWFVPFAPSVLDEDAEIFIKDPESDSVFMIMAYESGKKKDELVPAVVHVDGTIRPQIVYERINPVYWRLLKEFKKLSGVGVLINTSFNRHGLPIVESPKDAIEHLLNGHIEILVMGNFIVERRER